MSLPTLLACGNNLSTRTSSLSLTVWPLSLLNLGAELLVEPCPNCFFPLRIYHFHYFFLPLVGKSRTINPSPLRLSSPLPHLPILNFFCICHKPQKFPSPWLTYPSCTPRTPSQRHPSKLTHWYHWIRNHKKIIFG